MNRDHFAVSMVNMILGVANLIVLLTVLATVQKEEPVAFTIPPPRVDTIAQIPVLVDRDSILISLTKLSQ